MWGLWKQNISLSQLKQSGCILSWSAKWTDKKKVYCATRRDTNFLVDIHDLLSDADAVVHYNGSSFDVPWLNAEFVQNEMPPPAPFKQIDLYRVVKRQFKLPSYKLAYVAPHLGIGTKVDHMEFKDWPACMAGDEKAWSKMIKYNKSDVILTEKVYYKLLPWIHNHPNAALYMDKESGLICPTCGGDDYIARGKTKTNAGIYKRYSCQDCNKWFRGTKKLNTKVETVRI